MWINPESCAGKATNTHMYLVVVWVTVAWLSVVAVCWRRRLGAGGLSWPVEPVTGTPSHWHQITTLPRPALSTHLLSTLGAGEGSMWWLDREQWGCSDRHHGRRGVRGAEGQPGAAPAALQGSAQHLHVSQTAAVTSESWIGFTAESCSLVAVQLHSDRRQGQYQPSAILAWPGLGWAAAKWNELSPL